MLRTPIRPAADGPGPGEGYDVRPSTLRDRLAAMPPVDIPNLWRNKVEAITGLAQVPQFEGPDRGISGT
jgi:hypothetical protein